MCVLGCISMLQVCFINPRLPHVLAMTLVFHSSQVTPHHELPSALFNVKLEVHRDSPLRF
jgi:hypothetical protein